MTVRVEDRFEGDRETARATPPRLDVQTILRGGREAILLLGSEEYRLRLTSNGKLILTK